MLCAIRPATHRGQPAPFVAVVVEPQHLNRLADDAGFARHRNVVLEGLPEGPKLLGLPVRVCGDLVDQFVQFLCPDWHFSFAASLAPYTPTVFGTFQE